MKTTYPTEWDDLPRKERRRKIKELKVHQARKKRTVRRVRSYILVVVLLVLLIAGIKYAFYQSPEQLKIQNESQSVSLDGLVEELPIEGASHIGKSTRATYESNPPTSGDHYSSAQAWGVYTNEIDDRAAVHALEHGGIWITYTDLDKDSIERLEQIGKMNASSVIVSPRSQNDSAVAVVSWGKMMKMDMVDEARIQKYITTFKNQSPEKLAR